MGYRQFTAKENKWLSEFQKVMAKAPKTLFLFVGAGQTVFTMDENNEAYRTLSGSVDANAPHVTILTKMLCDGGDY